MPPMISDSLAPRTRLALGGLALLLFFGGLGSYPLLEPDEGRYAEIPREMLAQRDFVTPRLNGVLYFEKPPLYYWLNAAALSLPGSPGFLCRMANAVFGLAGLGLAWRLGRSMGGTRTALLSAIVLGTSPLWIALARANIIDMTLTFLVTATLTCFWLAQERERGARGERAFWYGMFLGSALATLTKGLIGIIIPGGVIFFYLLFARRWRLLLRVPWVGGIVLFLLVTVPWHALAARRNPDFLWFYFVHEHLMRYATPEANRQEPFWFFVAVLALGLLPWSGLLPAALVQFRHRFREGEGRLRDRPYLVFLACWAGFVFFFFSTSQSKLVPYILPAMPPLALLIALAMQNERLRTWVRAGGVVGGLILALLAAALLWASFGKVAEVSTSFMPALCAFALAALAVAVFAVWSWRRHGAAVFQGLIPLALASALIVGSLVLLGPRAAERQSTARIARALAGRLAPGDEIYAYRCYPQTLPFYLGRVINAVDLKGELKFGVGHLTPEERARRFPSAEEFRPIWNSAKTVYMVLEGRKLHRMAQDGLVPGAILVRQDKYLLLVNHPTPPPGAS